MVRGQTPRLRAGGSCEGAGRGWRGWDGLSPLCQLQCQLWRSRHLQDMVRALVCWGSGAGRHLARAGFFLPGERIKSHPMLFDG